MRQPPGRYPTQPLWPPGKDLHRVAAELRHHGEFDVEALLLEDADLLLGERFSPPRARAPLGGRSSATAAGTSASVSPAWSEVRHRTGVAQASPP